MFASVALIAVGVFVVLAVVASILLKVLGGKKAEQGAYVSRGTLMSPAEQEFYRVLRASVPC